jgi:serine/threonine protein kinase
VIYDGLITYKGLPAPIICDFLSREDSRSRYAPGTEFQIGKIEMVTNTGTYVDCPFHRYEDGKDLSEVELERFADLSGIVIRADHKNGLAITAEAFKGKELRNRAVLVDVGIARRFGQFVEAAGTPGFVAPEVVAGHEATPRSDVYGLAATAYALLTLAAPWGEAAEVIARQTSGQPVQPPSTLRDELAPIDQLIADALAIDPSMRPATAGQFASSLRATLSVESVPRKAQGSRVRVTRTLRMSASSQA